MVEASWSSKPGKLFDEGELVLSLDGGRTFSVRVSAEIEPGETRVEWRVPDLVAAHARLALRFGREGDAETERIELVSAEFAIVADAAPDERLFRVGSEWRTREALATAPRRSPFAAMGTVVDLVVFDDTDESADAPRPESLETPAPHRVEIASQAVESRPATLERMHGLGSSPAPLRL
jgi:hypothetical protein